MPGLAVDARQARKYYTQAAGQDYSPSRSALASMMLLGQGGPVDEVTALRPLYRSMELGDPSSFDRMGWVQATGRGEPLDEVRARYYYNIAATLELTSARNELGRLLEQGLGGPQDLPGALAQYQSAVLGGNALSGANAAWLIFENPVVFPDQVTGLAYCLWAVDHAVEPEATEFATWCETIAADRSPAERRMAEKIAQGL